MRSRFVQWVRTADSPVPAGVRAVRRAAARVAAVRQSGSVTAFMDEVIAEAPSRGRHPAAAFTEPDEPTEIRRLRRSRPQGTKIVAVSTYPLHPQQSGGQLRGWHLAEALHQISEADVSVVSLTTNAERAGVHQLAPGVHEHCVLLPASHTEREAHLRLVVGPTAITDIAAALLWRGIPEFTSVLTSELRDARAGVLVQPYLGSAVRQLAPDLPIVCDEHNDELLLKRSIIPSNSGGQWLLRHVDRIERIAIEDSLLTTATTETDLESLGARYRLPTAAEVVPNGVDTGAITFTVGADRTRRRDALAQATGVPHGRPTALFVGSGHRPNIDAGRLIIHAARDVPEVEFLLAGRHAQSLRGRRLPRNVHLLGHVSESLLELLLSGADIALNPMNAGSGSNLKLVTYLAAGLPVVSTVMGARGIDADEAGILTVEPDRLADGIRAIVGHHNTDRAIAGRHYVEQHGDWRAIGRRFARLVEEQLQ